MKKIILIEPEIIENGIEFYLRKRFPRVNIVIYVSLSEIIIDQLTDEVIITHGHPYINGIMQNDVEKLGTSLLESGKRMLIVYSEMENNIFPSDTTGLYVFINWTQDNAMERLLYAVETAFEN